MTQPHRPFVIALIGGIACGKSFVASLLEKLSAEIISADAITHNLYDPSGGLYLRLVQHFGSDILNADHQIDRTALKAIILENPEEKNWLESLVHPEVRRHIQETIAKSTSSICVIEIPLLKNRQDYPYLDYVLWVTCDPQEQCKRLMHRNHLSQDEARRWMALSVSADILAQLADGVIDTTQNDTKNLRDVLFTFPFASLLRK